MVEYLLEIGIDPNIDNGAPFAYGCISNRINHVKLYYNITLISQLEICSIG